MLVHTYFSLMILGADRDNLDTLSFALHEERDIELIHASLGDGHSLENVALLQPDVLLIDLSMMNPCAFELIAEIAKFANPPAIVAQTNFLVSAVSKKCTELGVCTMLSMPYRYKALVDRLHFASCHRLYENKTGSIGYSEEILYSDTVTSIMRESALPMKYCGYAYIRSALIIMLASSNVRQRMTFDIYPAIANEFGSSPSRVERDIRTLIAAYWKAGGKAILERKFGLNLLDKKPSNTEFLTLLNDLASYNSSWSRIL